jgi:hypothetical protein
MTNKDGKRAELPNAGNLRDLKTSCGAPGGAGLYCSGAHFVAFRVRELKTGMRRADSDLGLPRFSIYEESGRHCQKRHNYHDPDFVDNQGA